MKLNLGAGDTYLNGYVSIDRKRRHEPLKFREVYPLTEWGDESCDEVRASHVLEHFSHRETEAVLREWIRVLKPGGWLKVAVPDFRYIAQEYLKAETDAPLHGYCMGGQVDENDYHKAIFDEDGLRQALEDLGLVNVQRWQSEIKDCASLPVSLNLMGQKRIPGGCEYCGSGNPQSCCITPDDNICRYKAKEELRGVCVVPDRLPAGEVVAVMSCPRLSFTDNAFSVIGGIAGLGIRVLKSSGVFWGQCLTELIEQAIASGAKYVLTIDYDTIFKAEDVRRLYALCEAYQIDGVMGLQMKRDGDYPLFTKNKEKFEETLHIAREDFQKDIYPVFTGHFGLTLLRCASFAKLEKPWFRSEPDSEGRWTEKKRDEDIAFWHNWHGAGNSFYLAPKVVLGHLQLMATWPDENLQARHQYTSEYHKTGKPEWSWK